MSIEDIPKEVQNANWSQCMGIHNTMCVHVLTLSWPFMMASERGECPIATTLTLAPAPSNRSTIASTVLDNCCEKRTTCKQILPMHVCVFTSSCVVSESSLCEQAMCSGVYLPSPLFWPANTLHSILVAPLSTTLYGSSVDLKPLSEASSGLLKQWQLHLS